MPEYTHFINDEQWKKIELLLPKPRSGHTSKKNGKRLVRLKLLLKTIGLWAYGAKSYRSYMT